MKKRVIHMLLSVLPLAVLGMAAKPSKGAGMDPDFTSIFRGNGPAGGRSLTFNWIRSEPAWRKVGYAEILDKDPDFSRHDVLIFTMGEFATTGASIELLKIEKGPKTIFHLKGNSPDPKLAHGQMITHPIHVVRVAKGLPSESLEFRLNDRIVQYQVHIEG